MLKKLIGLLITIIIFGNFSIPTIANTEKEVEKCQAIQVLSLLNIISGYENNMLKLDQYITRAEMATIIVRSLGYRETIEQMDVKTGKKLNQIFKDVLPEHWATHYIHIAYLTELIKGVENGRFNPDDNISYQDAVTMLLRALRYEFCIKKVGHYPEAYLSVAEDIGVLENINLKINDPVTRKDAIQMVFNCLTINMMAQVSGLEPKWEMTDENILTSYLKIDKNYGEVNGIKGDYVYINDIKYKIVLTDAKEYVGAEVCFYYIENGAEEKTLIILKKD